jgi:hypothetical protein
VIAFLSKKLRECNADPLELINPDWDHMAPLNRAAENGFDRVVEEILKIYEDTATPVEGIFHGRLGRNESASFGLQETATETEFKAKTGQKKG